MVELETRAPKSSCSGVANADSDSAEVKAAIVLIREQHQDEDMLASKFNFGFGPRRLLCLNTIFLDNLFQHLCNGE